MEDIKAALIYYGVYAAKQEKDGSSYYDEHSLWSTQDPQVVQMEEIKAVDDAHSFVSIACRPYDNGVWVTMGFAEKVYHGYTGQFYTPPSYTEYGYSHSILIDMSSVWRSKADRWAHILLPIAQEFNGSYDYGFSWAEQKANKKTVYVLTSVNMAEFPSLEGINIGDELVAVNGISTSGMRNIDLSYWFEGNGSSVIATFRLKTGEEKKVMLVPKLRPGTTTKRDYKKIIEKASYNKSKEQPVFVNNYDNNPLDYNLLK